jgi:beta-glucanase (GH16 family)
MMIHSLRRLAFIAAIGVAFIQTAFCQAQESVKSEAGKLQKRGGLSVKEMEKQGWQLTFQDEFSGSRLDTTKWIDSYPDNVRTHSNNEQQYYAPDGYVVSGGRLRLKAEKRTMGGMPYTSGMVSSYGKFAQQFGWFEIRARFPKGKGMWPAFWLLPNTKAWPPEIDVLEILGHEPDKVYMTNHYRRADGRHEGKGDSFKGPDFSAAYHTFALEWEPAAIVWYVDGAERYRTTENIPSEPMYLLANLAVGGDWPGNPDDKTVFPAYMDIDYIRVYKQHAR